MRRFISICSLLVCSSISHADYIESYGDIFSHVVEVGVKKPEAEVIMSATHLLHKAEPPKLRMKEGQFYKITYKDPTRTLFVRSLKDEINAQALVEELDLLGVVNAHYVPYKLDDYPEGYGDRFYVKAGPFDNLEELSSSEDALVRAGYLFITESREGD